jgi:cbb3-type cytochrome oxidase maturation protein
MNILIWLAPLSVLLGFLGLAFFLWTFHSGQYEDPKGSAARILDDHLDAGPGRADGPTPRRR